MDRGGMARWTVAVGLALGAATLAACKGSRDGDGGRDAETRRADAGASGDTGTPGTPGDGPTSDDAAAPLADASAADARDDEPATDAATPRLDALPPPTDGGFGGGDGRVLQPMPALDVTGACDVEVTPQRDLAGAAGTLDAPGPYRPCGVIGGQRFDLLIFSGDGRRLIGIGAGGQVQVLDARTLATLATFVRKRGAYTAIASSADGEIVAAYAERDGELDVWRTTGRALLHAVDLGPHRSYAGGAAAVSPDGALAVAAAGNDLVVLDVATGARRAVPQGPNVCGQLAFVDGGRKLLAERHPMNILGATGSTIDLVELATGAVTHVFISDDPYGPQPFFVSADGSTFMIVDEEAEVWDAASGQRRAALDTYRSPEKLSVVGLSADGQEIRTMIGSYLAPYMDRFQHRRVADNSLVAEWQITLPYGTIAWSPVADVFAVAQGGAGAPSVLVTADVASRKVTRRACGEVGLLWAIDVSRDGSTVVGQGYGGAYVFDVASGRPLAPAGGAPLSNDPIASPDGHFTATGRDVGDLSYPHPSRTELLDLGTGAIRVLADNAGVEIEGRPAVFSQDSRLLAVQSLDGTLGVFEVASARRLAAVAAPYQALGFAPDGQVLHMWGGGNLVDVRWSDGAVLAAHPMTGTPRATSGDGVVVVTETQIETADVYRAGALVATMPEVAQTFSCAVTWSARISGDGSIIASTLSCNRPWYSPTGEVTEMRDAATGALVQALPFDHGNALSWDGKLLAHGPSLWCR